MHKKLRFVKNFLLHRQLYCSWQITYRCNFACNFCDYWKLKPDPHKELSLTQIEQAAKKLARIGSMVISVAGGEPLLRNDLPDIIALMNRSHFPVITTNGFLVKKGMARTLYQHGLLGASISLDYAEAHLHDQARGVDNAFIRAQEALALFSEERTSKSQRVNILCVLKDDNLEQIEPLIRLAKKYQATCMVQPYCSLKTGQHLLHAHPQKKLVPFLVKLKVQYPCFASLRSFLNRFDEYTHQGMIPGCQAGSLFFNIDNYGNIALCVEKLDEPLGNILSLSTAEVTHLLKNHARTNTCAHCWYNCRGEIESLYTLNGIWEGLKKIAK